LTSIADTDKVWLVLYANWKIYIIIII
jgi:hypothetical protein